MKNTYQRQKIAKKMIGSTFIAIIVLFFVYWIGIAAFDAYKKYSVAKSAKEVAEKKIEMLSKREKEISEKVQLLNTDLGIEQELRKRFDIAKEGEKVVVIYDDESKKIDEKTKTWWGNMASTVLSVFSWLK